MVDQIRDDLSVLVTDGRALGYRDPDVLARAAVTPLSGPVCAALGTPVWMVTEGDQGRDVAIGLKPDVTAVATIATVGTSAGYMCLTTERNAAGTAVTTTDVQTTLVDKIGHLPRIDVRVGRWTTPQCPAHHRMLTARCQVLDSLRDVSTTAPRRKDVTVSETHGPTMACATSTPVTLLLLTACGCVGTGGMNFDRSTDRAAVICESALEDTDRIANIRDDQSDAEDVDEITDRWIDGS